MFPCVNSHYNPSRSEFDVIETLADQRREATAQGESTMTAKQAFDPVVDALTGMAGRIFAASRQRRTERLTARFSTHLLRDIGFDRDWDGSIYRPEDRA